MRACKYVCKHTRRRQVCGDRVRGRDRVAGWTQMPRHQPGRAGRTHHGSGGLASTAGTAQRQLGNPRCRSSDAPSCGGGRGGDGGGGGGGRIFARVRARARSRNQRPTALPHATITTTIQCMPRQPSYLTSLVSLPHPPILTSLPPSLSPSGLLSLSLSLSRSLPNDICSNKMQNVMG